MLIAIISARKTSACSKSILMIIKSHRYTMQRSFVFLFSEFRNNYDTLVYSANWTKLESMRSFKKGANESRQENNYSFKLGKPLQRRASIW